MCTEPPTCVCLGEGGHSLHAASNHTSSGIVGFTFLFDVLRDVVQDEDLALSGSLLRAALRTLRSVCVCGCVRVRVGDVYERAFARLCVCKVHVWNV